MKIWKIILYSILGIILIVVLSFGTGMLNVFYNKTVGKAKQNVEREVYEETNSFTKAKRMEAIKLYKEYNECKTDEERKAIETVASMSFADFDEDKYIKDYNLLQWIKQVKY